MDKGAQEKIAQHIAHATDEDWQTMNPESKRYAMGEAELMIILFEKLGYRKLPDKPPPLVSWAMEDVLKDVANTLVEAQREADIKHYGGLNARKR